MVVVHHGQNFETASKTVKLVASRGGTAFALQADLASCQEIERFFLSLDEQLAAKAGSNQLEITCSQ
jgi:hypothetical protein